MLKVYVLLVVIFACSTASVDARQARVNEIPNGSVSNCGTCHVNQNSGGARNAFGQAIENGFLTQSGRPGVVVWNATLAALDSDGDGFSNGTELGDPDGDGTPTPGAQVTNPGSATSLPQVVNNAPTFGALAAQMVNEGDPLSFTVTATDQDNDTVTITAADLPTGATFESGAFTWTPGFDQSGMFTVNFTATDGTDPTTLAIQITVENIPQPPIFDAVEAQGGKEGEGLTFTIVANDADGDNVTLSASELPTGAVFDNGTLMWTPGFDQAGDYTLNFTASDGTLETVLQVPVSVENVAQALAIASINPSRNLLVVAPGDTVRISVVASAEDLSAVTYTWSVNGFANAETGASLLVTASGSEEDDVVSVTLADGSGNASQSWTVSKNLVGDFNGNNEVDFPDFLAFVGVFGKGSLDDGFDAAMDLNANGAVDFPDFLQFVRFFGLTK